MSSIPSDLQITDWRFHLKPDEAAEYELLELHAAKLDRERRVLTNRMNLIRNRCAHRRRQCIGRIAS